VRVGFYCSFHAAEDSLFNTDVLECGWKADVWDLDVRIKKDLLWLRRRTGRAMIQYRDEAVI
jgi:hypothetical protein